MTLAATPEELERSKELQRNATMTNEELEKQSRAAIKACTEVEENIVREWPNFIEWLDERKYYD